MKTYVYVSGWRKGAGEYGLCAYELNCVTGEMTLVDRVGQDLEFNVTHYDAGRGLLYALEEAVNLPGCRGGGGGRVFVFRIDPATGKLTQIECKPTWCVNPCYLTLDESGRYLLVAHHGSKSTVTKIGQDAQGNYYPVIEQDEVAVELFAVAEDGTLGKLLDVSKHYGSGPERRQVHAQPHCTVMSPSGKLFAVCDKGADWVGMYQLDREKEKLIKPDHIYRHAPGTLPRYSVFHPHKHWFYHNTENTGDLHAFSYEEDGLLQKMSACDVLPKPLVKKEKVCEQQGLVIDRSGRYIYDVVRGPNVVSVIEVDQTNGSVEVVQHMPVPGLWPRGCTLSPDGKYLLVCCVESGKVVEFAVGADGRLSETGREYINPGAAYVTICSL